MYKLEDALHYHSINKGKIEINSKVPLTNDYHLTLAYSPGAAEPSMRIYKNPDMVYRYTSRGNMVAVVTNGTAVLGLGNIGPSAALPVMEGKAQLFKTLAGIDAFPILINSSDPDEIVKTVKLLEPTFGGINLEDIAAPECFMIEERLNEELNIPVFHDDQHGTAVVVMAALINALKLVDKALDAIKVVINGAGASALATARLLLSAGVNNIIVCDSRGIIYPGRVEGINRYKAAVARQTNPTGHGGKLADALVDADVFIGLSRGNLMDGVMVKSMARDPIIFALANPEPEINPRLAVSSGAKIVGTGRSDYPNQINNNLGFPGIFRGALDVRASEVNMEMKVAAARAIAGQVSDKELSTGYIIPKTMDPWLCPAVAAAVAAAAMKTKVARVKVDPEEIARRTHELFQKNTNYGKLLAEEMVQYRMLQ
ncbi:malate dehydrogenase (oxaloacetate-decarboxylating) [Desulfohalotomaculum tongense]|uniref:NAD(P)-dependent malic enzyme n=1 Tax=Desulforadius tongensis TaxID=1216062 RepID=UPI00195EEDE2|nr:malic enzyme-like NAD(P)-binding protein [Desulforadius tongensis]MBM7854124.1 malate dehydrogenase (oxaloacetate-decarboxylating) [Desulforadius tongensis]